MEDTINPFKPRRIRIEEPGWAGFTGHFGTVEFLDGVSVDPVPWIEQQRLAGLIRFASAEDGEDGAQLGPSAELSRNRDRGADDPMVARVEQMIIAPDGEARLVASTVTREELEAVADAKGITGLREIAKGWNVKGRSVNELINEILEAQKQAAEKAGAPAEPEKAD
jgi:hypothetical protein